MRSSSPLLLLPSIELLLLLPRLGIFHQIYVIATLVLRPPIFICWVFFIFEFFFFFKVTFIFGVFLYFMVVFIFVVVFAFWSSLFEGYRSTSFLWSSSNLGFIFGFQLLKVNSRCTYLFLEKCTYWLDHEANENDEDDSANSNDHQVCWDGDVHDSAPCPPSHHGVHTILHSL